MCLLQLYSGKPRVSRRIVRLRNRKGAAVLRDMDKVFPSLAREREKPELSGGTKPPASGFGTWLRQPSYRARRQESLQLATQNR